MDENGDKINDSIENNVHTHTHTHTFALCKCYVLISPRRSFALLKTYYFILSPLQTLSQQNAINTEPTHALTLTFTGERKREREKERQKSD